MFIFGAVPDDLDFEFDPVSEPSDEIEPQSEIGGDSLAWAARKTALEPRIQFRSDKAGDTPPRPRETTTGAKGGARQLPFLLYRQR